MPDEGKDRDREDEDFEPLDTFFAPIEDVDWPEAEGGGQRPRPPAERPARTPAEELEDDLLAPDLSDDPLAGVEAEIASSEPESVRAAEPEPALPPDAGEPTAEMSGEDWEELRLDVGEAGSAAPGSEAARRAGEGEAPAWEREPGFGEPVPETWRDEAAVSMGGDAPPYPERETEDELSLEDLKNPPPEYVDLPPPPGDAGVEPPGQATLSGEPPLSQEVGPTESEPELEELEAAADHFAEALRDEPQEPGSAPGALPTPQQVERELLADLDREPRPSPTVSVGVGDTLGGPSWQEPTSEEVTAAPAGPPVGGRNLPLALLSGVVLVGIGVGAIAWGRGPFTAVAGAVIVLAQGELYAALHRKGYQPATALGLVFGALISAAAYLRGEPGALAMFALGGVFTFLWFMAVPAKSRHNTLANVMMTIGPLAYVALLGGYVMVILSLPGGRALVLSVVGLTVGYDIAAFAIGSLWGSRPLAPSISPRKSWEGAIGATLILLLVSVALLASLDPIGTVGRAIGLALVISVAAPLGDLAESMLKRDLGVKDMGSLIPGHGGILDRIDSILFAAPAAFYFLRLVLS